MKVPAERHLDDLEARLETLRQDTRELAALRDDQLLWRPAPARWGVADCFEHLLLTDASYGAKLRDAIDRAPPPDPRRALYTPGLIGRWFIRSAGPDHRLRLPAPKPFRPPSARPDAPERYLAHLETVSGLLDGARSVDLQGAYIASPLTSLLRFTIGEALTLIIAHGERHLQQAKAVRAAPGFPG